MSETPLQRGRRLIAEWLASGSSEGADAYDDDAMELLYCLADEGLTVVTCDPHAAYDDVRYRSAEATP